MNPLKKIKLGSKFKEEENGRLFSRVCDFLDDLGIYKQYDLDQLFSEIGYIISGFMVKRNLGTNQENNILIRCQILGIHCDCAMI